MMPASDTEISRCMSYVLRHAPQDLDLMLSDEGWTDYATFSAKLCAKLGVTDADIRRVIDENAKKRFTLTDGRIRAAQGHSVSVDLDLKGQGFASRRLRYRADGQFDRVEDDADGDGRFVPIAPSGKGGETR